MVGASVALALLSACGGGGGSGGGAKTGTAAKSSASSGAGAASAAATPSTAPQANIVVTPAGGAGGVRPDSTVTIKANSPLTAVTVKTAGGTALAGTLSADKRGWTSTGGLVPAATYQVSASAGGGTSGMLAHTAASSFTTLTPAANFKVSWNPVDGQVVGVGAPIQLEFSGPVSDRAALEKRLVVKTSPAVEGSWHWFSDRRLHWRPKTYWATGTKIHIEANLLGFEAGPGRWGVKNRIADFAVGTKRISYIDNSTHMMKVYENDKLVRTIPASLGRPSLPTMDGPHNVLWKSPEVIMDSATVGIPKGDPDYYYEKVPDAVNFTSGGLFVHAADWSVASQGRENVSHGCVNISPANAKWFYGISREGDIVDVKNTGRPPDISQLGNDWSLSWAKWKAGDALTGSSSGQSLANTTTLHD